jgi:tetratricopeptide (TPR) repeat protein
MSARICAVALVLLLVIVAACAPGASERVAEPADAVALTHVEGLGSLSFPNSGAAGAQEAFHRGVLLLHSFEFESSAEAFREAQGLDADFALAYWGEAMTYNHPLWRQKDVAAAHEVLGRYAPIAEERLAKAPSERERRYLEAVEILFGDGDKMTQDLAYMGAMQRLSESYPDDHEARTFYALSILGSTNGTRDFATYMRAAATAQPTFLANPKHPGAAHYLIHSFDDPVHAPLGLPAARLYAEIAPGAAHAQHMTTHIFVAMGMWEKVVSGNVRASEVQDAELAGQGKPANVCGHHSSWLHYGRLMTGDTTEAEAMMDRCYQRMSEDPTPGEERYFVSMRARQILDSQDWSLAERWQADLSGENGRGVRPEFVDGFTNAFAALRRGDATQARAFLAGVGDPSDDTARVYVMELRGLLALHDGDSAEGIDALRSAAALEDSIPFAFGPPTIVKPTFELLGEELLGLDRYDDAHEAFARAAERTPGRTLAVGGLQAAAGSGG